MTEITGSETQTPISNERIQVTNVYDWNNMSISELNNQLDILQTRCNYALQMGRKDIAHTIEYYGMEPLKQFINYKLENANRKPYDTINTSPTTIE